MLESTGVAGIPNEWLNTSQNLLEEYEVTSPLALQRKLWKLGTTPNGVFGLKLSMHEPHNSQVLELFHQLPNAPSSSKPRTHVWEAIFPNCRHLFMTRRNKIRLAVSWWKAIKTDEWHRHSGTAVDAKKMNDGYSFDAIKHLLVEVNMREAAIQEFFTEGNIVPLTIVYEDFISDYKGTLKNIFHFLKLPATHLPEIVPPYEKLADKISEDWVQRFRLECQAGWVHRGW